MTLCTFTPGARLEVNAKTYHLRRKLSEERWQLENDLDGELMVMAETELRDLYQNKQMRFFLKATVCPDGLAFPNRAS